VTARLDPYDVQAPADRSELYGYLREHAPTRFVTGRDVWTLSRFADVASALGDPGRFSSRDTNGYQRRALNVLVGTDPPEHTRLRQVALRALAISRLRTRSAELDAIVARHTGRFIERGRGEVVTELAEPLACEVFAELIGLDHRRLVSIRLGRGLRPDPRQAYRRFLQAAIDAHRSAPGEDLIGFLVADGGDSGQLSDEELLAFLGLLLAAGADTSRDLIANLLAELAARPAEWDRLLAEPQLVASAIEECLRFSSPIQAVFRTATCDVNVGEAQIEAGDRVMALIGSADRDERRWADAQEFDVGRYRHGGARNRSHIAFGGGPHICPGAWLGRRIARGVLSKLVASRVRLELTGPPRARANPCFGTLLSVPLVVRGEHDG
jgi:cytochrome P450